MARPQHPSVPEGLRPVAVRPPQLAPEAFGAGLFEQRTGSAVSQRPRLLLASWSPPADQLTGALVALGTLAHLRNGPFSSPSPAHLPWLLERCVPPSGWRSSAQGCDMVTPARQRKPPRNLFSWSLRLRRQCIVLLARVAALLALPPDEFLLPRLHPASCWLPCSPTHSSTSELPRRCP